MPFKTRLKPNFEMLNENAWGKTYEKATYPHREKKEIKTIRKHYKKGINKKYSISSYCVIYEKIV